MQVFNTLTGQKEDFRPRNEVITMYVCGITAFLCGISPFQVYKSRPFVTPNAATHKARAAEVAVIAPLEKTLSYAVPAELLAELRIGSRVRVPLGRRQTVGYVMDWVEPGDSALKDILEVIDPHPLFHARHAAFYRRAALYYAYPPGEVVRTALPAGLSAIDRKPVILHDKLYRVLPHGKPPQGARQREILDYIRSLKQVSLSRLRQQYPAPHAVLKRLEALGCIAVEEMERCRDPFAEVAVDDHLSVNLNSA